MSASPSRMTKAEQENLLRLGRLNRDGAIAEAKRHTADAAADFEMRLAAAFSYDKRKAWAELMRSAKARVAEPDRQLAADCLRLGIPDNLGTPDAADVDRDGQIRKKPDSKPSYHRIISFETTEAQARWQRMVRGAFTEAGVGESAP